MAHSHAEVPSLQCPQCGASFTAEIGLSGDEDKLREAPAAAVPPAVAEVVGTSVQEVNSELTGRAGAELVTLEAAMAAAAVGAGKKGGKRRLAPAVMLGLLGASLLAACAPAVVEPQAGVATIQAAQSTEVQGGVVIASTEEPTEQPEAVASLTPKVVGLMVESPNKSGWLPPTTEDTILTNQAGGGELPPELQPLIDRAQATIAATGFTQARVETVTNGLNSDAFRAAFVFRIPEGVIWAQGSAYPSQLKPDGSVSQSHAYVLVPGSADARIEWTAGADGPPDTETTLVKHTANLPDGRQAALLYWHTTEQAWKPIGGYPTAQEFVAVGDTVYQFSPEDGSAVEIGTIADLQSLSTNNGRVEATDANGQVFWFEEGRFVNEALLAAEATAAEAQKVAEYVEANGAPIHLATIPGMRLEATEQLQQAIWNRIPKELQELGPNPLFLIIPDADRLRAVIDTLSIQVEGHENKVPLAGREVVFTFMSVNEEVPDVMLPLFYGMGNGAYRIGAYEAPDGSIRIVVRTSNQVSTSYSYEKYPEWELVNDGFIYGLFVLSGSAKQAPDFQNDFSYDAVEYDHLFPGNAQNKTKMTFPVAAKIDHDGQGQYLFTIGFVDEYRDQLPPEYQEVNR